MERTECGRIKIVGSSTENQASLNRRLTIEERVENESKISEYFERVIYPDTTPESVKVFSRNSIYIGCLGGVSGTPRRRVVETVNLQGSLSWYRRGSTVFSFVMPEVPRETPRSFREEVIRFKFDGKTHVKALFYKTSKTLILGMMQRHYDGPAYVELVMAYLKLHGMIERRIDPNEPAVIPANTKRGVEFHGGQRIFIELPLPRKSVKVGCDPEFEYINPRNHRPERAPHEKYNGTGVNQEIGLDGAGAQVEIRPKAFEKPADVVSYMIGIMTRLGSDAFSTKGDVYPLGGHIHVGVGHSYAPPQDLLYLLDYFLGKPTVKLSGEARSSYKKMGAYETKPWGFEYRTPPAAIFNWPEFARLSMKICKNVTECFINGQTIIINEQPEFEDYWNYCAFTPHDYEKWQLYLSNYSEFMANPNGYHQNVVQNWINPDAIVKFPSQVSPEAIARRQRETAEREARESEAREVAEREEREARIRRNAREMEMRRRRLAREQEQAEPRAVFFNDDWTEENSRIMRRALEAALPADSYPRFRIYLFGLSEQRGEVTFGYHVDGMELCSDPNPGWVGYGVCRRIRMSDDSNMTAQIMAHAVAIATAYVESLDTQNNGLAHDVAEAL